MTDKLALYYEDRECRTCPAYKFSFKIEDWKPDPVEVDSIPAGSHVIRDGEEMVMMENGELRHLKAGEPELWDGVSIPEAAAAGTTSDHLPTDLESSSRRVERPVYGSTLTSLTKRKKIVAIVKQNPR